MCTSADKIFSLFPYLPMELSFMVLEELHPDDKIRFTRCSKLSRSEVNASKDVIHEISFTAMSGDFLDITVSYGKYEDFGKIYGYQLVYICEDEKKYIKCLNPENRDEFWKNELKDSADLVDLAVQKFKDLLQAYGNKIKKLSLHGSLFSTRLKNFDFGITGFRNLEELHVFAECDILQIVSKLRRPLKKLFVNDEENCRILMESKQIYEVQQKLCLSYSSLDIDQFLELSVPEIVIHIGKHLNERNLVNFIRQWQNDTLGKRIDRCFFDLTDSIFYARRLLRLLGLQMCPLGEYLKKGCVERFEIKHQKDSGKIAELIYKCDREEGGRETLEFVVRKL